MPHNPDVRLPKIAAELDAAATHHATPCGDGEMVWRQWGAGEPIILVHGGSGSWTHFLKVLPALIPRYEVWACDLPGLGDSAMPAKPWTPESSGAAVADGIRRLIPAERRPSVVAFSFGVHVASFALIALGDHVRSFTISGCSALGLRKRDMPGFPKERSSMSAEQRADVHRQVLAMLMISQPSRIDDLAIALQAANVRRARFRSREFALTDEVRCNLAHIRVPLRAIWGEKDAVAIPDVATVLQVIGEDHPELVSRVIPDAGHWVMYEQAEAYTAALLDMLQSA